MENSGWIKLHRKMTKWGWYSTPNVLALFIHLIFLANREDQNWKNIKIKRGQLVTSIGHLAEDVGLSIQQTRTALDNIKLTNEITIETTSKYTLISINNYCRYQEGNKVSNKQVTNEQQTSNKQITTIQEHKNIRNKEIYKESLISPEKILEIAEKYNVPEKSVNEIYLDLILYCRSNGKTYKDYEAALMNWVRRSLKKGEIKVKPHDLLLREPVIELSPEQRAKNLVKIDEIKAKFAPKLHL